MANVVGGTSMADSAPAMTTYDVNMEAGILPQTKELGGGMQDVFDNIYSPLLREALRRCKWTWCDPMVCR